MMCKKIHINWAVLPMLCALFLTGCTETLPSEKKESGSGIVTLNLDIPGSRMPQVTRSITSAQENAINTIDVLAFKVDQGEETFLYRTYGAILPSGSGSDSFRSQLSVIDGVTQRLVVIANAREEVDALFKSADAPTAGALKNLVLEKLIFDCSTQWNGDSNQPLRAFPMWGESTVAIVDAQTTGEDFSPSASPISMLRALAAVNVGFCMDLTDFANPVSLKASDRPYYFDCSSIQIYNIQTKGYITPLASSAISGNQVIAAVVPPASDENTNFWEYNTPALSPMFHNQDVIREIYLPENNHSSIWNAANTCVLISGDFGSDGWNKPRKRTWYRVDFATTDSNGETTMLQLLRNHIYNINIVNLTGYGYDTAEEALANKGINISMELTTVNLADMKESVTNDKFQLLISEGNLFSTKSKTDGELSVYTDYPKGWKASVTEGDDWITLTNNIGTGNVKNTMNYTVAANSGASRKGIITLVAGTITKEITVSQQGLPLEPANCYILHPNGEYITFPVSQANADGITRIQAGDDVTAEVVWLDAPNIFKAEQLTIEGVGTNATISVRGANKLGNVLIAAKVNGVIKWNWHIWMTDYDPEVQNYTLNGATWMLCNLGATSVYSNSNQGTIKGLIYQWGRKDPFPFNPGQWNPSSGTAMIMYDLKGTATALIQKFQMVAVANNLDNSIANPTVFYASNLGVCDWYTNGVRGDQNDNLWNNTAKSAYDPCPKGWKVSPFSPLTNTFKDSKYDAGNYIYYKEESKALRFPAGGYTYCHATQNRVIGTQIGYSNYWSSTFWTNGKARAVITSEALVGNNKTAERCIGASVRCVKDN